MLISYKKQTELNNKLAGGGERIEKMISTRAFTGLLIVGLILLFIGILGTGFAPLEYDVTPFTAVAVLGVLIIVIAIIYLMVQSAKATIRV